MNFKPNIVKKDDLERKGGTSDTYEPVTSYMAGDLITFHPDSEMTEVIDTMLKNRISGAPVLDDNNKLIGLISEKDCLKIIIDSVYHNQPITRSKVTKYMTTDIKTIPADADVLDAANEFFRTKYKRFPVVDDTGKLVGQISRRDILQAIKAMNISVKQKESGKET